MTVPYLKSDSQMLTKVAINIFGGNFLLENLPTQTFNCATRDLQHQNYPIFPEHLFSEHL